jgi:tRNA(fMet)-specific endonuclease VapC
VICALDTTALSSLIRSEPAPSRRFLEKQPGEVAVPQPVLAEICYGLARLPRSRRRRTLEERLAILLAGLERLAWTDDVSVRFGELKAGLERRGERVDDFDVAIAAHAVAYDATLITRNLRHFVRIPGLRVEDWS